MILTGLTVCLVALSFQSAEAQVKFEASFFGHLYNHAGYQKLFNLAKGLNGDSNLAARKKRLQNWHKNNFGTITVKSFLPLDNKTMVLAEALRFLEYREAVSKLIKNCAEPTLKNEYGNTSAKKAIDRFWVLDRLSDGTSVGTALHNTIRMLHADVTASKQDSLFDIPGVILDEAYADDKKGGLILLQYEPKTLQQYGFG